MKRVYESPVLFVEQFVANSAVSACTVQGGIEWTFDCMKGPEIDKATVVSDGLASGCANKVGFAPGVNTAYSFGTNRHSDNNPTRATWGDGSISGSGDYSGSYISVTYSGEIDGLLYADADGNGTFSVNSWSTSAVPGVVAHTKGGGLIHRMVAPVIDTTTVNASW